MSLTIDDFGRLLAAKRGSRGVRAAALDAGVSPATFSRVENGHMPDLKTFASLCRWLSRDPREFLGIEVQEEPSKSLLHRGQFWLLKIWWVGNPCDEDSKLRQKGALSPRGLP